MDRNSRSFLRSDTVRWNRSVGPAEIHPSPYQAEGADEDADCQLHNCVERFLFLGSHELTDRMIHGWERIDQGDIEIPGWRLAADAFVSYRVVALGTFRQPCGRDHAIVVRIEFEQAHPLCVPADLSDVIDTAPQDFALRSH